MHRRDFLRGVSTAALTAAWSRVAGAVVRPAATPLPRSSRYLWAGERVDRMWRDVYRRRIDGEFYMQRVLNRSTEILRMLNCGEIDEITAAARMFALHSEALRNPPPPREIPPLPAGEIGVDEVMALLRRAIAGEARIVVEQPWKSVWHTEADFSIDGWRLTGFKRTHGIKSVVEAIAPDGRRGTHESWNSREGNPVHLLSDDEQDDLSRLMEGLTP
jgi:hypothetical protein